MRLLFLGPPGVGKGTQAVAVSTALGVPHISTGDMFRGHLSEGTPLGLRVKEIMARGDLVPDSLTTEMLLERLSLPDADNGYILDGFPRTPPQAKALDDAIGAEALDATVVLEASDEVLVKRMMARGRSDDTEVSVRNRLAVYERETAPLIGFYEDRGIVRRVSGTGRIEAITDRVLGALADLSVA